MSASVDSLALLVNVLLPLPRPRLLLLSSCYHCCRHCHCYRRWWNCCCCHHHCFCYQVIVRHVHCCHCHPSRFPLNAHSLMMTPCSCPLPLPSHAVFIVHHARHRHCHPLFPPSNANDCWCHLLLPLPNTIFAPFTLPQGSNNQTTMLTATVVHYPHQTPTLITLPSMRCCHHWSLPPSNANTCCKHLPPSNADAHNYNARGRNAANNCSIAISLSLDSSGTTCWVQCCHWSWSPPSAHPPHCHPSPPPSLVDCWVYFTNFSTFILAFTPPISINILPTRLLVHPWNP